MLLCCQPPISAEGWWCCAISRVVRQYRCSCCLQVTCSVIGRNCHIGRDVHMVGCYIQDHVQVCDGAQLTSAMVCEGSTIMHNAVLHPGCIVSFQVGSVLPWPPSSSGMHDAPLQPIIQTTIQADQTVQSHTQSCFTCSLTDSLLHTLTRTHSRTHSHSHSDTHVFFLFLELHVLVRKLYITSNL